jgi:ATP-dependent Zn protease
MRNRVSSLHAFFLVVCCLMAGAPAAWAAKASSEPYSALESQIKAHKVQKATVESKKSIVKVKTSDGKTYKLTYPAGQETALVSSLKSSGAKVHVDKKAKSSSHFRLRYLALIVLALAALAALVYWLTRRRSSGGPGAPVTIGPGPANPPA